MAGILDSKSRVIDAKLTRRGRMSIAEGGFNVKYVSFSDIGATYEDDGNGIAVEPLRLGLESFSTSDDEITITTDNNGKLVTFEGDGLKLSPDGKLTNSKFFESGSLNSFRNQRLLSSRNSLFEDPGLSVSPKEISFSVTDIEPFNGEPSVALIDDVESLFFDKRLSNSLKFKYLPPVQRTITSVGNEALLGNYTDLREAALSESDILSQMSKLQNEKLTLSKYTKNNEVCIQLFESSSSGLAKLDIIKFGDLQEKSESGSTKTLYFVGKIFEDGYGSPTFVNIFDMVIE
jgi:hypothetical protein